MAGAEKVKVGFQYRPYAGFVEELYDDTWLETEFYEVKAAGEYQISFGGLKQKQEYQFRATIKHPKITMYSNIKKFKIP
jgi:hypothetical protein